MINQILFKKVRDILNKYDPIKLISIGCPKDEYDPEVKLILKNLEKCKSIEGVNNLIYNTFVKMFEYGYDIKDKKKKIIIDAGFAGKKEDYGLIAREIFEIIKI